MSISICIPTFNEELNIKNTYYSLNMAFENIECEFIFINDSSTDNSEKIINELAKKDKRIILINNSTNLGQQKSIYRGFLKSSKKYVAAIDCDLQDPPIILRKMYDQLIKNKSDIVIGVRKSRKERLFVEQISNFYYSFLKLISKKNKTVLNSGDFYVLRKGCVSIIKKNYIRGSLQNCNYKKEYFYYERKERKFGKSHYTINKKIKLGIDGIKYFLKY